MARKITKRLKAQVVREYRNTHVSLRTVAEKYGVTAESVRRWAGYRTRPRGTKYPDPSQLSVFTPVVEENRKRSSPNNPKYDNANKKWSKMEDEVLRDAIIDKLNVRETMNLLGRTEPSIWSRKCILISRGFIDEKLKFIKAARGNPDGIVKPVNVNPQVVAEVPVVKEKKVVQVKKKKTVKVNVADDKGNHVSIGNIVLSDIAKLVKDYGVGVTLTVTENGTEVRVHK